MRSRRLAAFLLILVQAVTYGCMMKTWALPAIAAAAALAGLMLPRRVRLDKDVAIGLALGGAILCFLMPRLTPDLFPTRRGLLPSTLSTLFPVYLMLVQTYYLFARGNNLPAWLPVPGAVAMICSGSAFSSGMEARIYQSCALDFAILAAFYSLTFRAPRIRSDADRPWGRRILTAVLLVIGLALAVAAAALLQRYERRVDAFFVNLLRRSNPIVRTGFSGQARLDSVNRVKFGAFEKRVAIRVIAKGEPGYLRGKAFSRYHGAVWKDKALRAQVYPTSRAPDNIPKPREPDWLFVLQAHAPPPWKPCEIWPAAFLSKTLFLPFGTAAVVAPTSTMVVDRSGIATSEDLPVGTDFVAYVSAQQVSKESDAGGRSQFLQAPEDLDPRIRLLANRICGNCATSRDKMRAVVSHFHDKHEYGTDVSIPPGADPLTHFLIHRPAAHCEYFATGAALLLRLAGVPTRYVTGFVAVEKNPSGDYWIARNRDAHAWAEAYDQERQQWVIVEATPPAGAPQASGARASLTWDAIKFRLRQLIVMARTRGLAGVRMWLGARLTALGRLFLSTSPVGILAKTAIVAVVFLLGLRKWRRRQKPTAEQRQIESMRSLLARLDRIMGRRGLIRRPCETLHHFARRLRAGDLPEEASARAAQWYRDYAVARYGAPLSEVTINDLAERLPDI